MRISNLIRDMEVFLSGERFVERSHKWLSPLLAQLRLCGINDDRVHPGSELCPAPELI
jgi:hypothetical protein